MTNTTLINLSHSTSENILYNVCKKTQRMLVETNKDFADNQLNHSDNISMYNWFK
ncbi:hypothetical protein CBL_13145 [Carabus blaptoides fortunei]